MLKDTLKNVTIEDVHKRICGGKLHTLRDQMTQDVKAMREVDIPLVQQLLLDLGKPVVHADPRLLHFYGGMMFVLNVIAQQEKDNEDRDR